MKTVTVSGTTLFRLAVQHYGDVGQWVRIAEANRLYNPVIGDARTIKLPEIDAAALGRPEGAA